MRSSGSPGSTEFAIPHNPRGSPKPVNDTCWPCCAESARFASLMPATASQAWRNTSVLICMSQNARRERSAGWASAKTYSAIALPTATIGAPVRNAPWEKCAVMVLEHSSARSSSLVQTSRISTGGRYAEMPPARTCRGILWTVAPAGRLRPAEAPLMPQPRWPQRNSILCRNSSDFSCAPGVRLVHCARRAYRFYEKPKQLCISSQLFSLVPGKNSSVTPTIASTLSNWSRCGSAYISQYRGRGLPGRPKLP